MSLLDLLAQISQNVAFIGGGAFCGTAVMGLLIKRSIDRVMNHVDNARIHIRDNGGYVSGDMCDERTKHMAAQIDGLHTKLDAQSLDTKEDTKEIREALKEIFQILRER